MTPNQCREGCAAAGICAVIPTYNNARTIIAVVTDVRQYVSDIFVINDGSTDGTAGLLEKIEGITLITHPVNLGKGAALKNGFSAAYHKGFKAAITIDSDAQHYPSDIPLFLSAYTRHPGAIIVGARNMSKDGIPARSSFGNAFSNFWLYVQTGCRLPDTQSGFRIYPLNTVAPITLFSYRFEFEIEILVRSAWRGAPLMSIPIQVHYEPKETRVTHFRPIIDFLRISALNTILTLIGVFIQLPRRLLRRLYAA